MMRFLPKFSALSFAMAMLIAGSSAQASSWLGELDQAIFGESPDIKSYNEGVSLYQAGKHDEALAKFQLAIAGSDRSIKAKSLHNAALVYIEKKELPLARDLLKDALAYDNEKKEIRENLEWVEKQLKNQEDQPKNNQNENQNQDQKQEEQKSQDQKMQEQNSADQNQKQKEDRKNDQMSAEQKQAEQKQAENSEAKKDQKDKAGTAEKDPKDQKPPEKAQQMAEQKRDEENKAANEKEDPKSQDNTVMHQRPVGQEPTPLTSAEIQQQEAERLLREIDDKIGQYPLTDTEATSKRGDNGKNW